MPTLKKNIGDKLLFENVPLSKLSEFYIISIEYNEGESEKEVIKIPTEGIPETRDDEIFRSIVDTKEKFYNYCMAHVRRKFTDAQSSPQTEIGYIRLLYELEVNLKAGEAFSEETGSERQAKTIPTMDTMEVWMQAAAKSCTPSDLLGKELDYAYKLWSRLRRHADNEIYQIDNNPVERWQRPSVMGCKNYLFYKNDRVAENNAVFYSQLESCRIVGINQL